MDTESELQEFEESGTRTTSFSGRSRNNRRGSDHLDSEEVGFLFGPTGPLASAIPGFEHREAQADMAVAVAESLRDGGELLVEAGTGTGKTMAYLIPAILSGQRVVISTGTKNLQEQLFYKDIPLVRKALRTPFSACLMKGRSNYLCLQRFQQFAAEPMFRFIEESEHLDTIDQWNSITKTGDRAEIPGLPDTLDFWRTISAKSENCVGRDCSDFQNCYVTRLRQRATDSEIVIVNHHLLFADLMVREGSYGEVLPPYDYLVIDEAHQIEDVATQYFGATVSNYRIDELVRDSEAAWRDKARGQGPRQLSSAEALRRSSRDFFLAFHEKKDRFRVGGDRETPERARRADALKADLERLQGQLKTFPKPDETTVALGRRGGEILSDLDRILSADDPESVSWCERRERSTMLRSSPLNVSDLVRRNLLDRKIAVVMTSATLAVDGSLDYVRGRLGVRPTQEKVLASPFDFARQTLLYIPRGMPAPRDPSFTEKAAEEVLELTRASQGRAFVLFTSFANLHAVRRIVTDRLPYPLLVQGEASRSELLATFRETENAVLLATSSFWEGVDVVGEQLSCVIIDKLPFAVPSDPLVSARIDWVESRGEHGFQDFQVPLAILGLKQGVGRLIRSKNDRGVLAVLDSRLVNMRYGRRFLSSLPPCPLTHDRQHVFRFFDDFPE